MSNLKVLAINGAPGSGKTTFENMIKARMGAYYCSRSTIDFVKEIATKCGWDGTKTLENRKFLSDLKDLLTSYNDGPMRDIRRCLENFEEDLRFHHVEDQPHIFCSDVREPAGLQRFKDEYNAITILIRRAAAEEVETSNHADAEVLNFDYDYIINNNGTLDTLQKIAYDFVDLIFSKN